MSCMLLYLVYILQECTRFKPLLHNLFLKITLMSVSPPYTIATTCTSPSYHHCDAVMPLGYDTSYALRIMIDHIGRFICIQYSYYLLICAVCACVLRGCSWLEIK